MRPLHPNDVTQQAVLNRVRGAVANSITVASSLKMSELESSVFDRSATGWRRHRMIFLCLDEAEKKPPQSRQSPGIAPRKKRAGRLSLASCPDF